MMQIYIKKTIYLEKIHYFLIENLKKKSMQSELLLCAKHYILVINRILLF